MNNSNFQKKELPLGNIESRDQWKSINTRSVTRSILSNALKETTNTNVNKNTIRKECQSKNINQDLYYRNPQSCNNSIGKTPAV